MSPSAADAPAESTHVTDLKGRAKAAKLRARAAKARVKSQSLRQRAETLEHKADAWERRADELDGVVGQRTQATPPTG